VVLAEPAADYQLNNSLFLVAHFHTMIVSGVLFGYFAGFTYWFPRFFGFKLNEKLGTAAFWCWLFGFILAFGPLYVLGFMGATRRIDHYAASLGYQTLFIVAAIGAVLIGIGLMFQILQFAVSIKNQKANMVTSSDPWDGRSLEWSIPMPIPSYNFAVLPVVESRDAFWDTKQKSLKEGWTLEQPHGAYTDIRMPKNSCGGIVIAGFMFFFGFGVVWHLWWLAIIGLLGTIVTIIVRTFNEDTEMIIPAAEVEKIEKGLNRSFAPSTT
jgi:cytochrome o ubiquinol oxidase subunit 1